MTADLNPGLGRAVLGCRCGRVVDAAGMRCLPGHYGRVSPIVCPDCVGEGGPVNVGAVAAAVATAAALLLAGCAPAMARACGTYTVPPYAVAAEACQQQRAGVRWYTAPAVDVADPDEQPVVGQPLDGDWWDPADRGRHYRARTSSQPVKLASRSAATKARAAR